MKNKKKLIIGIISVIVISIIAFLIYFYINTESYLYSRLNEDEKNATKLTLDWYIFFEKYSNEEESEVSSINVNELYYYLSAEKDEFLINTDIDIILNGKTIPMKIGIVANNDNFEQISNDYITSFYDNIYLSLSDMTILYNSNEKNYKNNSFEKGSIYKKIDDKKLKIINKLLAKGLSKDEINEKYERFNYLKEVTE